MVLKMKLDTKKNRLATLLQGSALIGAAAVSTPSQALEYQLGEWAFNVDTTLGYSAQWRVENRDGCLEGDCVLADGSTTNNNNDGNNNFDDGSMTSSKANIILELGGSRDDFSFFIRQRCQY